MVHHAQPVHAPAPIIAPAPAHHAPQQYVAPSEPKTIYVNVPPHPQPAPLAPIAAGPPRKHYKIVFVRAPAPPPQVDMEPGASSSKNRVMNFALVLLGSYICLDYL